MRSVDFVKKCVCVFTALAVGFAQPAIAVAAGAKYLTWEWVASKEKCVLTGDSTTDDTASNQASPLGDDYGGDGEGGDVFDLNSKRHAVAQQIFDLCTKKYGLSGAAAVGILVNVKNECGFNPRAAEGSSDGGSWAPEHCMQEDGSPPNDGRFAYSDSGGGAGLMQFTPYTTYTESDTFKNRGTKSGWDVELQMEFVFSHNDAMASSSLYTTYAKAHGCPILDRMEFFKSTDAAACVTSFMGAYLRPNASCEAERNERAAEEAAAFSAAFNPNNLPANDELLRSWNSDNDSGGSGAPTIDTGGSTSDKKTTTSSNKCKAIQEGEVDGTTYIDLAKQYAEDESIGYSIGARTKPNMDCSSFVYYCLVDSGAVTEAELGGGPFSTSSEGAALTSVGFTEMDYSSGALQKGDILWRDGHTEIYMGKYDGDGNESADGQAYSCGAHNDGGHPDTGDQLNKPHWWEGGQEVGGDSGVLNEHYEKIYRPPAKFLIGKKGGNASEVAKMAVAYALSQVGCSYTHDPSAAYENHAFNCSGLTWWAYEKAGLEIPHGQNVNQGGHGWGLGLNDSQLAWVYLKGNWVTDWHQLKPGDLMFFGAGPVQEGYYGPSSGANRVSGHVAMYIGDGQLVEAIEAGVVVQNAETRCGSRFLGGGSIA